MIIKSLSELFSFWFRCSSIIVLACSLYESLVCFSISWPLTFSIVILIAILWFSIIWLIAAFCVMGSVWACRSFLDRLTDDVWCNSGRRTETDEFWWSVLSIQSGLYGTRWSFLIRFRDSEVFSDDVVGFLAITGVLVCLFVSTGYGGTAAKLLLLWDCADIGVGRTVGSIRGVLVNVGISIWDSWVLLGVFSAFWCFAFLSLTLTSACLYSCFVHFLWIAASVLFGSISAAILLTYFTPSFFIVSTRNSKYCVVHLKFFSFWHKPSFLTFGCFLARWTCNPASLSVENLQCWHFNFPLFFRWTTVVVLHMGSY